MKQFSDFLCFDNIDAIYNVVAATGFTASYAPRASSAFVLFAEGKCDYFYRDRNFRVKGGDLLFLPQEKAYSLAASEKSQCLVINFQCRELRSGTPVYYSVNDVTAIRQMFEQALVIWERKEIGYKAKSMGILYNILAFLQSEMVYPWKQYPGGYKLKQAYSYIHAHYCDPGLRIPALARECGMSERAIRDAFQEIFGTSPIKYINNLRMIRAAELIAADYLSLSEIAELCGFRDVFYFSNCFKKHYGVAPSYYPKTVTRKNML